MAEINSTSRPPPPPRAAVETPCIKVCAVNPKTGHCEGCYRSLKEIAGWSRLEAEDRQRIMAEKPAREARAAEILARL